MKFDSFSREQNFIKQHKNYVVWIIVLILIAVIIGWLSEFREEKEWRNNKEHWNRYENRFRWEKWNYRKGGNENNEWNKYSNEENENASDSNESNESKNITKTEKENKIILPLTTISEADASKAALASNTWSQTITSASMEDEGWTVVYSFVLDNKTKVKIDAVNGKVIANKDKWNEALEKKETIPTSGTGASK